MIAIKEKWTKFKQWQKQPYQVAPMSDEEHVCSTCSTEYVGNFCPRCGQSSKIVAKMSIWKTFLLFIDVWGLGNRGMFRTLRDLILRPGYMICDYLRGMHQAYFPPFKLLFLLTTLSLLIGHGWNLRGEKYDRDFKLTDKQELVNLQKIPESEENEFAEEENEMINTVVLSLARISDYQVDYPALYQIVFMIFTTAFYFKLFRKTKTIGKMSFQEFFVAMIYVSDMVAIYTCVFRFFGMSRWLIILSGLTYLIPLKQMTGYGWWKTTWRYFLTWLFILLFIALAVVLLATVMAAIIEIRHL